MATMFPNSLKDMETEGNNTETSQKSSPASVLESIHDLARSCNRALETMRVELMTMTMEMDVPSPSLSIEQEINLGTIIDACYSDLEKMNVEETNMK